MNTPKFTTYIEVAQNLFAENPNYYNQEGESVILSFAKYLDSGIEGLNNQLQILALMQSRKVDGEVLHECIEEFGKERMTEIVLRVHARHLKHKKML